MAAAPHELSSLVLSVTTHHHRRLMCDQRSAATAKELGLVVTMATTQVVMAAARLVRSNQALCEVEGHQLSATSASKTEETRKTTVSMNAKTATMSTAMAAVRPASLKPATSDWAGPLLHQTLDRFWSYRHRSAL